MAFTALIQVGISADWDYDFTGDHGPFHWADLYEDCGGDTQSPINIHKNTGDGFSAFSSELSSYAVGTNEKHKAFLNLWDWNEEFVHHSSITNNGHSVAFVPMDNALNELRTKENGYIAKLSNIFGTSDTQEFGVDSFHLHWVNLIPIEVNIHNIVFNILQNFILFIMVVILIL